jgi:hypothetical protein
VLNISREDIQSKTPKDSENEKEIRATIQPWANTNSRS